MLLAVVHTRIHTHKHTRTHARTHTHTHTNPTEAEELGSKELEIESKKFLVEVKSNEQGKFVKILEVCVFVCLFVCV